MEEAEQELLPEETTPEETVPEAGQDPGEAENKPKKKRHLFNDFMEILETMVISVFVILMLFTYIIRPVTVDGRSMVPTLHDTDRLVMFRLCYTPQQGDIVVVSSYASHVLDGGEVVPGGDSLNECLIKRVIAVGGQKLEVDAAHGKVYVDGVLLDEPYIAEATVTDDGAFDYPIIIPDGYVFVMGDNRNHSTDSRSRNVGLVKNEDVLGRAFFRYHAAEDTITGAPKGNIGFIK